MRYYVPISNPNWVVVAMLLRRDDEPESYSGEIYDAAAITRSWGWGNLGNGHSFF